MTVVNIVGSQLVASAQTVIVYVVLGILTFFAVVTLVNINPSLLAPSGYPPLRDIISSVALTFFAFLGFGIITFTAKDLAKPSRQLPRAMYLALGIATVIYIAIALGVFGTLTVDKVIASGGTALAVAAEPTLGKAGYWLMTVTALFSTAGATNAGLYPAPGLSERLAETGQFPPLMARKFGGRLSAGLLFEDADRHTGRPHGRMRSGPGPARIPSRSDRGARHRVGEIVEAHGDHADHDGHGGQVGHGQDQDPQPARHGRPRGREQQHGHRGRQREDGGGVPARVDDLADIGAVDQRLDQHLAQPDGDRDGRDGQQGPLNRPVIRQATAMTTLTTTAGIVVPGEASHRARPRWPAKTGDDRGIDGSVEGVRRAPPGEQDAEHGDKDRAAGEHGRSGAGRKRRAGTGPRRPA